MRLALATCALVTRFSFQPRHAVVRAVASATAATKPAARSPTTLVSFVTDVEGNLGFWRRFCELSEVIEGDDLEALTLRPGCHLVFGGDAVDKSAGDLRFLHSLLGLRRRHPDNVHLVLGNRDINKMRLLAELSPAHWLAADEHPGVYWRANALADGSTATPATFLASQPDGQREDSVANRLRYMLADNMGSPKAFELRRAELAELAAHADTLDAVPPLATGGELEAVSDEMVLESYLSSVLRPDGLMREYLQHAKIAVRLGSALFVHGGIHPNALGAVPGRAHRLTDIDEWIRALNEFAAAEVAAFCEDADSGRAPSWRGASDRGGFGFFDRPGGRLLSYGMATQPDLTTSPTVVYSSYLRNGHPTPPDAQVTARLAASGIHALVVGHQPHGDAPVVMRCPPSPADAVTEATPSYSASSPPSQSRIADDVLVITADTSFSDEVEWQAGTLEVAPGSLELASDGACPAAPQAAPQAAPADAAPSRPWLGRPLDPRGQAVFELLLRPFADGQHDGEEAAAVEPFGRIHGVLSNGRQYDTTIGRTQQADATSAMVGQQVGGGRWWVKAQLESPNGSEEGEQLPRKSAWLASRGEGYAVRNAVLVLSDGKSVL